MVDVYGRAQEREQEDRERAIQNQLLRGRETETPNEVDGIRYCLDCGHQIDSRRLEFRPESVRCVDCQNFKDVRSKR